VFTDDCLAVNGARRKTLGSRAHFDEHFAEVPGSYFGGDPAQLADDIQ